MKFVRIFTEISMHWVFDFHGKEGYTQLGMISWRTVHIDPLTRLSEFPVRWDRYKWELQNQVIAYRRKRKLVFWKPDNVILMVPLCYLQQVSNKDQTFHVEWQCRVYTTCNILCMTEWRRAKGNMEMRIYVAATPEQTLWAIFTETKFPRIGSRRGIYEFEFPTKKTRFLRRTKITFASTENPKNS